MAIELETSQFIVYAAASEISEGIQNFERLFHQPSARSFVSSPNFIEITPK